MPNNWKKYKLGEVVKIVDSLHKTPTYSTIGLPMVRVQNIDGGFMKLDGCIPVSQEVFNEFSRNHKSQKGDLVFSRVGAYSGKASIVKEDLNFCLGQNTAYIIPKDANSEFLFYLINSTEIQNSLNLSAVVSSYKTISLKSLKELEINLPPLPEQQAIAEILSSLDDKIELNLQTNKILEEMANALYKHWFVDFGPFKAGKFIESELGVIPKGWEVQLLNNYVDVINGFAFKGNDFIDSGVPVLKIKNVKAGKILLNNLAYVSKEVASKAAKAKIYREDILITMTGNRLDGNPDTWVGKVALFLNDGEYYLNQRVSKIKIKDFNLLSKYYLSVMLASSEFQNYFISNSTSSGGQANISPDLIKNIAIVMPPENQMKEFDKIVSDLFHQIYTNDSEIEILKQTRDYLLPKLISGEIQVKQATKLAKQVL